MTLTGSQPVSRQERQRAHPDPSASDDDDTSELHLGFEPGKVGEQQSRLLVGRHRLPRPEQYVRGGRGVGSGKEGSEVGVLGDHHPVVVGSRLENLHVVSGFKPEFTNMKRVVAGLTQARYNRDRQVRVDEQPHASPTSGSSRSCTAWAANSRAASMSSVSRSGKSARICSRVRPAANCPRTVLTGTRSPRTHGSPPIWSGLIVIRSYDTPPDYGADREQRARIDAPTTSSKLASCPRIVKHNLTIRGQEQGANRA